MTWESGERPIEILLVEDDPADARLTEETLKGADHQTNMTLVEDGETAMSHLRREGAYESSPRPDLILLDMKLPGMDGPEVLAQLSGDPDLASIPVMILTGTEAERSLLESYNIPPSRYCRKPLDLDRFHRIIHQLGQLSRRPIQMPAAGAEAAPEPAEPAGRSRKRWWPFG